MSELAYLKKYQEDKVLDKLSVSDFVAVTSLFMVKEAEGPNHLREFRFGRQDVK